MVGKGPDKPDSDTLRHVDLSGRAPSDLTAEERAELTRRFNHFMSHVRAGKLNAKPSSGNMRRIRKWQP